MIEEFEIKLKMDASPFTSALNKIKNDVSNVNKVIKSTGATSNATASTAKQAQTATTSLTDSVSKVTSAINKLKNMSSFTDVLEIASEFVAATVQTEAVKKSMGQVEKTTERVTQDTQKWVAELREALLLIRAQGNTSEVYATGGKDNKPLINVDYTSQGLGILDKISTSETDKLSTSLAKVNSTAATAKTSVAGVAGATAAAGTAAAGTAVATTTLSAALAKLWTILAPFLPAILTVVAALAAVIAVVKLVRTTLAVAQLGHEIYFTAQRFNMSAQAFQEWSYIMQQTGSDVEDLKGFLETLASEQAAVVEGSEGAIDNFKRLGMSIDEVVGSNQQELFEKTVKNIQNIEDATQRSAIAYSIFGDEASRLMNILNMSSEEFEKARNNYALLGGTMSGELLESSTRLQNSINNMKQAWQGISNTLAEVFMPVVQAVVNGLTKMFVIINLFIRTIAGLDLKPKGAEKAINSNKAYTSSVGAATKAVEKLKRTTMGFDELNIVQDPNSSSAGSGAAASMPNMSGGAAFDTSFLDASALNLEPIYEWFEEYKTLIQDITTWTLLLGGLAMIIFGFGNIPVMLAGAALVGLGITFGSGDDGTFERIGKKVKGWWNDLKKWFDEKVKPVFTKEYWTTLWDNIKVAAAEKLDELGNKIFKDKWEGIKTWFREKVKPIFTKQYWITLFDNIKQGVSDSVENTKKTISEKWKSVQDWFAVNVKPKFTKQYWVTTFENIRAAANEKLEATKTTMSNKWEGIKKWFATNVKPKFTATYWKEKFSSIKDGAKESFNGVIGIVESAVNKIVKKINTLSWVVPDWVPAIGGDTWGFNFKEISIPRLATGGIATGSTLANIGEAGAEAILPLENNTGWMDALADKIAARNQAPTKLVLNVGEKELGWVTINSINNITKEMGGLQLAL